MKLAPGYTNTFINNTRRTLKDAFIILCDLKQCERSELFEAMVKREILLTIDDLGALPDTDMATLEQIEKILHTAPESVTA